MRSGAADATAALLDAVAEPIAATDAAGRDFVAAKRALLEGSGDLVDTLKLLVWMTLALEALKDAAARAESAVRVAQARTMMSTGGTKIETVAHVASVKNGARRVLITGTVPPEFMVPQPDKPDIKAIGRRLRAREKLDFAVLSNGGDPVLTISARKEGAA